ncbi:iron-containing redox enzyme family protein [Prauserella flavalba]|uniref:Iron-containing redox enzyme family protein n=1 Tax=Prauserella flavalba TaxID=1477506 RepID=A0A318LEM2_9PSEU|nr:iron-containing redox enzyme family protein [Prauserella flavalba]PXY24474.1 hypothetical protein BA062_30165 [Prauserella flavalba]
MQTTTRDVAVLPRPRGPFSEVVARALHDDPHQPQGLPHHAGKAEPYGEDLQLALQVCYELHYRGFEGVDSEWEWQPDLIQTRNALERQFLAGLRRDVTGGDDVRGALEELLVEPVDGTGVSHWLRDNGTWEHLREYFVLRSIYHLKEADPHAFAIPRLRGQAKAALVAVEFDEYGGGRYERMHSRLYADLLDAAGLDSGYLHYAEHATAHAFAPVNLMSMFGLHRSLRGALVGHFAAAEITTAPSARRLAEALRRVGADDACVRFFDEHVEADAVHEQVMRREVIGDLLEREPELAPDVVFGIQATGLLEDRLAAHVLGAWEAGRSALRQPLS